MGTKLIVVGEYRIICYIDFSDDKWNVCCPHISEQSRWEPSIIESAESIITNIISFLEYDKSSEDNKIDEYCANSDWVGAKNYAEWFPYLAEELAFGKFSTYNMYYDNSFEIEDALEKGGENDECLWLMRHLGRRAFRRKVNSANGKLLPLPILDAIIG